MLVLAVAQAASHQAVTTLEVIVARKVSLEQNLHLLYLVIAFAPL